MVGEVTMESGDKAPLELDVETLIAGREKRSTAGNRMHALLDKEDDDELQLLFAENEEEEDVEFAGEDADAASDIDLDSSSDDDDQGPATGADDLDGERELERQAKAEHKRKRKQQEIVKRPLKRIERKLKGETTAAATPTIPSPKPDKKKSERVSWLPTAEDGAVRQSTRKHTMQNKQDIHQRLKESEKRRRHQLQIMTAAAKRKEATQPKVRTQADRMTEAARVERHNAKSLNHWEEEERRRAEERKAKLAALKNRKLSGRQKNMDEIIASAVEKAKSRAVAQALQPIVATNEKSQGATTSEANGTRQSTSVATDLISATTEVVKGYNETKGATRIPSKPEKSQDAEKQLDTPTATDLRVGAESANDKQPEGNIIDSNQAFLEASSMEEVRDHLVDTAVAECQMKDEPLDESSKPAVSEAENSPMPSTEVDTDPISFVATGEARKVAGGADEEASHPTPKFEATSPVQDPTSQPIPWPDPSVHPTEPDLEPNAQDTQSLEPISVPEPVVSRAARTLVVLEKVQASAFPNHVLMRTAPANSTHRVKRIYKTAKYRADPAAHAAAVRAAAQAAIGDRQIEAPLPEKCAITGLPARFRDPSTGLPYHDVHAYRAICDLKNGKARWSNLLGCYVGPIGTGATGVPEKLRGPG